MLHTYHKSTTDLLSQHVQLVLDIAQRVGVNALIHHRVKVIMIHEHVEYLLSIVSVHAYMYPSLAYNFMKYTHNLTNTTAGDKRNHTDETVTHLVSACPSSNR